jgi:Tol biopolymer transport system component
MMEPDRWQKIEELYHAALERAEGERAGFLEQACGGDEGLRREVESLLSFHQQAGSFIEAPALDEAARSLASSETAATRSDEAGSRLVGKTVSHYRILEKLGGGMGVVYKAQDTTLARYVALKFLPEGMAKDREALERFQREARAASAIDHPNICTIHEIGEHEGQPFIVMELMEGQTLKHRIAAKPLKVNEALDWGIQIADALDAAHSKGIIHRDIKPANIFITTQGQAKVLDFGLAKAVGPPEAGYADAAADELDLTRPEAVMGTLAYMSPEQARGHRADKRADIWAFGVVLYEMLTGRHAFQGETTSDTLAAVLKTEPNWDVLPANIPANIRKLLRRCLEKDPKLRLRDIGEARIAIEETLSGAAAGPSVRPAAGIEPSAHTGAPLRVLAWVAMGLIAGALLSGVVVWRLAGPASQSAMHFTSVTNFAGVQAQPALSPDDRSVAFVSNRDGNYNIYVGLVRGGNLLQITHDSDLESRPRWSPDGATIAYARLNDSGIWDIWEVPSLGGTPRRLILNAEDPAWSPDGRSLAYENTTNGTLWISGLSGENARQVTPAPGPAMQDSEPRFSPDGRDLAFTIKSPGPYGELEVVDLASGKVRPLTYDTALARSPAWSPDGRSIYFASSRGGSMNIWKIAATGGEPEQITAGQGDDAELDVSSDGKRIVFSTFRENINIAQLDLEAKPGQQNLKPLTTDPARNQVAPVYSADGKLLAYFSNFKGVEKEGIWVANADGSNPVQLVQDGRINIFPQWIPDNQHLIYLSRSQGAPGPTDEYRSVAVSGGAPQTILKNAPDRNFDVGLQGRLLFRSSGGEIQSFDPSNNQTQTLATLPASGDWGVLRWSPDGRSVAYIVDASREDDPNAGLWVDDCKTAPRQVFRGWVDSYARGPGNEIYFLEGKPDLNGVLWKVGWNGQDLTRTSTTIRFVYSYWIQLVRDSQEFVAVSPDRRHVAVNVQGVLQANIGMIENIR